MPKDTPRTELRIDQLKNWFQEGSSWCGSTELPEAKDIFEEIFQEIQWNEKEVLMLAGIKKSFDSHLHVGAFRKLPEETISKRALPVTAATTPWHKLLDNTSDRDEFESPQNVVNRALKKLDVPYQVATRVLQMVAYMPTGQKDENPIRVEDSRFTDEELVFQDAAGVPHPIQSLGSGIGVIVPVVVALSTTDTELLSIEEPESHVHPKLQTELGDIVIAAAIRKNNNPILIETHSEHLLLRIMRRMRNTFEEKLRDGMPPVHPEDVALLFVSPGADGSVVQEIGLNEGGELIKGWPGGFFEEGFNEMFD